MHLNNYFDGVYWINLDRSADRRRCAESWLIKEGIEATRVQAIDGDVLRFLLPEHERISRARYYAGCLASHLQAMATSKHRGEKRILILEDDFIPRKNFAESFDRVSQHPILEHQSWDMLYLGFIPLTDCDTMWSYDIIPKPDDRGLAQATRSYTGAYAYALNAGMRDTLLEQLATQTTRYYGVDAYLRDMSRFNNVDYFSTHRIFGVWPQLFAQADGVSTLTGDAEARIRRGTGGLQVSDYNLIHNPS